MKIKFVNDKNNALEALREELAFVSNEYLVARDNFATSCRDLDALGDREDALFERKECIKKLMKELELQNLLDRDTLMELLGEFLFVTNEYLRTKEEDTALSERVDTLTKQKEALFMRKEGIKKQIEETKQQHLHDTFTALHEKYPNAIVLFGRDDFFECYEVDAACASKILGIPFNVNKPNDGDWNCYTRFPRYELDTYLPKLVRFGKKIIIREDLDF